jgi:hypothetical protein
MRYGHLAVKLDAILGLCGYRAVVRNVGVGGSFKGASMKKLMKHLAWYWPAYATAVYGSYLIMS